MPVTKDMPAIPVSSTDFIVSMINNLVDCLQVRCVPFPSLSLALCDWRAQAKSEHFAGTPKFVQTTTPSWYLVSRHMAMFLRSYVSQSMGGHSLFESGEKEAKERLLHAKPRVFLLNNFFAIRAYLLERMGTGGDSGITSSTLVGNK